MFMDNPIMFGGVTVICNPVLDTIPRMTLSEDVTVTPEFRREMNKWLVEFFGYKSDLYIIENNVAYVNTRAWNTLRYTGRINDQHLFQ